MRIRETVSAARASLVPLRLLVRFAVVAALAATAIAAAAPGQATAASAPPCWKQVINDWFDGTIDRVYPIHCYREAIERLPEDIEFYSDAEPAIRAAMLAAMRAERGNGASNTTTGGDAPATDPDDPGAPAGEDEAGDDGGAPGAGGGGSGDDSGGRANGGGVVDDVLNLVGPRNADSIPLPLLVLAGIALLLLAAAAASFVARRVQARRVTVTPSADAPRRP